MTLTAYYAIASISALIFLSYLFNIIANKIRIPSAILLIGTGLLLQYLGGQFNFVWEGTTLLLSLLGAAGLVFIILESALDINIDPEKKVLIVKSLLASIFILILTGAAVVLILQNFIGLSLRSALAYAIPLSIISSAIAIPSAANLSILKKEFIIYESTFSDILGILLFNYAIADAYLNINTLGQIGLDFIFMILISFLVSLALLYFMSHAHSHIKLFLIIAALLGIDSIAKISHLPALLLIFIFGLILNNLHRFAHIIPKEFSLEKISEVTKNLKNFTVEISFFIRTFFFIVFGYTLQLSLLLNKEVIGLGLLIMGAVIIIRVLLLKIIFQTSIFPEIFIAPRGLITIMLFYSIPSHLITESISVGVVYFVIISSSILMTIGLIFAKEKYDETPELFAGSQEA